MKKQSNDIHLQHPESLGRDFLIYCDYPNWHWIWELPSDQDGVFINDEGNNTKIKWTRDLELTTCESCLNIFNMNEALL